MVREADGVFLMSDIVGSTRMWATDPEAMGSDLARHDEVLSRAIADHGGVTIGTAGDSFAAAFDRPGDAVAAAVEAQHALAATDWRSPAGLHVRMGVHLGVAQRRGGGWYGNPLNETARMMAAAHGDQILVSEQVADQLPDLDLIDLGEHRLRDLDGTRRLLQVASPGLPREFPSLRSMDSFVTTLPGQRTTLVGRSELINEIRRLLVDHRLVTLVGPGGVGKTRSAIEAAGRELGSSSGGVFFVDLTSATTDDDVVAAFVSGVRVTVPPEQSAEEHLASYLGGLKALLVVDNCEHVVDRAAQVVDGLLNSTGDLRVLATSREALRVRGEQLLHVPPLDVAGPDSAGVRLFVDRALATGAVIDASDLPTIAAITDRLDGIPLAIELAAAQISALTSTQLLAHLDDRFRLLRRGARESPERQQTLEATVAWSYGLLDDDEKRAFRFLSICAGPFTLTTAAGLLGIDELDAALVLDALASKSLIVSTRFTNWSMGHHLLETLREFGRRELSEAGETATARAALESALLPPSRVLADWNRLANEYISAPDLAIVVEDATRRDAAAHALEQGRLDTAAFVFSSCAFRDHPGELETTLRSIAPLAARRDDLDPLAWRAAVAAEVLLERFTRRYDTCFATSTDMLRILPADDPSRGWFEVWRCALTTAIAPEMGIAEIDAVLPEARRRADPPTDWTLSQLLSAKATGLASLRRPEEALACAEEALRWAAVGRESRDQALGLVAWLTYIIGDNPDPALRHDVAEQSQELGLAELCAAPGALWVDEPLDERASLLVGAARRRPSTDVPTPFLLAFAFLAVEQRDLGRAETLLASAEMYDASTQVALLYALARVRGWTDETWERDRDAAIREYLHPGHEAAAKQGVATLVAEVEAWERRLRADSPGAG